MLQSLWGMPAVAGQIELFRQISNAKYFGQRRIFVYES